MFEFLIKKYGINLILKNIYCIIILITLTFFKKTVAFLIKLLIKSYQ